MAIFNTNVRQMTEMFQRKEKKQSTHDLINSAHGFDN